MPSRAGSDGSGPNGGLIADSNGNLYGTTGGGGASNNGVVFKLAPSGAYTVLHSFGHSDGANPYAGLIADSNGNLYGTTSDGGPGPGCPISGCGVVFKLTPGGAYTVLYAFTGGSDGASPDALIADSQGNLYGTTSGGGRAAACIGFGCGVVLKLAGTGFVTPPPPPTPVPPPVCRQNCVDQNAACDDNCRADFGSCPVETPHLNCVKAFKACLKGCSADEAQCLAKCR